MNRRAMELVELLRKTNEKKLSFKIKEIQQKKLFEQTFIAKTVFRSETFYRNSVPARSGSTTLLLIGKTSQQSFNI